MRRRTAALCVCLLAVLACTGNYRKTLTGRLWASTEIPAVSVQGAVLDTEGELHVDLTFVDGRRGIATVESALSEEGEPAAQSPSHRYWHHAPAMIAMLPKESLEDDPAELAVSALPIAVVWGSLEKRDALLEARKSDSCLVVLVGSRSIQYQVAGTTSSHWSALDIPRDWWSPEAARAVVLTPPAFVADVVTVPLHVLWIFMTAGGHGDSWIPWLD